MTFREAMCLEKGRSVVYLQDACTTKRLGCSHFIHQRLFKDNGVWIIEMKPYKYKGVSYQMPMSDLSPSLFDIKSFFK